MKEHRIGVPRLRERICAAERSPEALNLKTLHRFLAGTARVNDEAVAVCARFAEQLPGHRAG